MVASPIATTRGFFSLIWFFPGRVDRQIAETSGERSLDGASTKSGIN
jgi:hypothetical protein